MNEKLAESNEPQNDVAVENVSHETEVSQPANDGKPAGYYPVQLDDLPSEKAKAIEDRFGYFYKQAKHQEKTIDEFREIARLQDQQLKELTNGVVRVVDHLQTKDVAETENSIRQRMQTAWESGDNKTYQAEQEKLTDLKVRQQVQRIQQPQNQTQQQAYAGVKTASQMAQDAVQNGEIAPQEAMIVNAWQDESDERGQPLRPWAKTENPNDPDPDYIKALVVAKKVWEQNPHRSIQENLLEVDRRMGTKKSTSGQTVMGGSLTTPSKKANIRLSPEIEKMAVRTRFGGPKAKTDAEHIAAYRKTVEETRTQGKR